MVGEKEIERDEGKKKRKERGGHGPMYCGR